MSWGQARRPKISTKLGNPNPREGSDGDIQILNTGYGAKLFGKLGGRWLSTLLFDSNEVFSIKDKRGKEKIKLDPDKGISVNEINLMGKINIIGSMSGISYATANVVIGNNNKDIGTYNICIGARAGQTLSSQNVGNILIGFGTGLDLTGGSGTDGLSNVAIGNLAGYELTIAKYNTLLGYYAGTNITTGDNNICIGMDAGKTGSPGGNITTADNTMVLGDENISASHIQTDWTVASDKRDKTDVSNLTLGLEFINKLTPVTYKWDKRSKYIDKDEDFGDIDKERVEVDLNTIVPDGTHKEDWLDIGFLAQDVETIENSYGHKISDNTNLTFSISSDGKQYGTQYTKFIPILTKAVQELSAKIDTMQEEINNLKSE